MGRKAGDKCQALIWMKRETDVHAPSGPGALLSSCAGLEVSIGQFPALVTDAVPDDGASRCGRGGRASEVTLYSLATSLGR